VLIVAGAGLLALGCGASAPDGPDQKTAAPQVSFTEVSAAAGLGAFHHQTGAFGQKWYPETMGGGGGFIDYNGDGALDLLLVGGGVWPKSESRLDRALWLYRNDGDGTFTLVSEEAGLTDVDAYALGVTVADYDNDGDSDFLLTTLGRNRLFRNDGDGTFTEVGRRAGLTAAHWSSAAVFFDADRDGHLDLYVGNYIEWSPESDLYCSLGGEEKAYCTPEEYEGVPGRFYHNDGDGTFTEWTERVGIGDGPGKTLGATILDYNRDGWMDLVVANDLARNQLFENDGDGTFTERGIRSGVGYSGNGTARAGMGVDVGVVDSTGEPTIFVGNFSREMIGVFRHRRDGLFVDRAARSRVGRPSRLSLTFGLFLFDAELDGDLDLFVANGHVQPDIETYSRVVDYRQPAQLFLNDGNGRFRPAPAGEGPLATPLAARGAAYGDIDGDGDLDVLVTENDGDAHLWRNDVRRNGRGPNYLRVALRGTASNRAAIGARIRVTWDDEREERLVRTGTSYLSSSERVATIGLGAATEADRVVVAWPSGDTTRTTDVAANQTLRLIEGRGRGGAADSLRARRASPPNARPSR
jgi:hypothetical protein